MNFIIRSILISIIIFNFNILYAENNIVFINMNTVVEKSKIGISIKNQFKKLNKSNLDSFKKIEDNLKKNEQDLISKKNILSQDEFKAKTIELRKKVLTYQSNRKKKTSQLNQKRVTATQQLFKEINPILATYSKENNIAFILDKRSVVTASTNLDITNAIIELLNKSNPKININ